MPYQRIICLVPSLTELLIDLGLKSRLVGRTRFCIHPEKKVTDIPIIGGTKNPRIEKILALAPDFILANKEENRKEDMKELSNHTEVYVTEIDTVEQAMAEIEHLGNKLGAEEPAKQLVSKISGLLAQIPESPSLKTAYFIWKDPWMTIGNDTYIHDVMKLYNLENVYGNQLRYPETSLKKLSEKEPEIVLLSSEPYPFKDKHIQEVQKACHNAKIRLVNGEWFSWYGSRMIPAFEALNAWKKGYEPH